MSERLSCGRNRGYDDQVSTPSCPTTTRLYERGKVIEEGFPPERIGELMRAHPGAVLWYDLLDPGLEDLESVQAEFGLHPLAVEDAVHDHQRPKLDRYAGHLFMNVYAVQAETTPTPVVRKTEISSFLTERALITVHKSQGDLDLLKRRWDEDADGLAADGGVGFLVYGMLDVVVDGQLAAARELEPYFRDVDDHARRAADSIESSRERINELLGADLNEQSNALNDITRKLAAWAAIIAVPTALTGFFGQNLPYPGYERWSGFLVSTGLILLAGGGLFAYLKSRKWL